MASNPPSTCCTVGVKHDGTPTGKSFKIGNIDAYVAEPSGKNVHKDTAILFLPDVIGIWQNSQLIADQYAANGYYTLIPDTFNGDPLSINRPAGFDLHAWLTKGSDGKNPHTYEAVDPIVERSIKYLQEQGFKKIGAVGYCFVCLYSHAFKYFIFVGIPLMSFIVRAPSTSPDLWQLAKVSPSDTSLIHRKLFPCSHHSPFIFLPHLPPKQSQSPQLSNIAI
ncbi:hypothetical protein ONS95_010876 [Cadophora gregata]|uniref:uncharacterized protein n=1 Tax=Cadophora gregata TaxID=51156 RepID=UPI0026DC31C3|nr:uncharacterized protein ONS95_010876 [Cadophora gregata]KAK0119424.1 hypothetical protein ONS95_010876 [Cadophora gregata]